jgi:glucuronate isomerase
MPEAALHPDRLFPADPGTRELAREIFAGIEHLPLVAVHGHVDPGMLVADQAFADPASLFVTGDHYVLRVLHSQGVALEDLGQPILGHAFGIAPPMGASGVEPDRSRAIWRILCRHWGAFAGSATRLWLEHELVGLFGVALPLTEATADASYDTIAAHLAEPAFRPRALFSRFGLELLSTTDPAGAQLTEHDALQAAGLNVVPTLRPDALTDPTRADWRETVTSFGVTSYDDLLEVLRSEREHSAAHGAVATDHGHRWPDMEDVGRVTASTLFDRLIRGQGEADDAERLAADLLAQMAIVSLDDGLVMQVHSGVLRDHDRVAAARFGPDKGHDFPEPVSFTAALRPILGRCGNEPGFRLVIFTVDETVYSRELAPMASYYPGLYLGAPWWFLDAPDALARHFAATVESAGYAKLTGFVDDTRAYCSIPARHDVARRSIAAHLATMVAEHRLPLGEAQGIARAYAYDQPRAVYLRR